MKASRHHCKGRALLARHSQVHDSAFYYEPPKASLQKQAVPTVRASSHLSAAARLACTPRVRAQQMLARHETIARVKRPRWTDEEIDALHHIVTLYMTPEGVGWKELTPQVVASLWPPASTPRKISQLASKWHAIGNARMTHEPQHGAMPLDRPPLEISLPLDPLGERHMEGHEATIAFNDDTYTVKFVKKGMEGGLQRYLLTLEGPGESEGDGGGDEGGDGDGGGGGDGGSDGGGEGGGEGGGDGGGEGGGNGTYRVIVIWTKAALCRGSRSRSCIRPACHTGARSVSRHLPPYLASNTDFASARAERYIDTRNCKSEKRRRSCKETRNASGMCEQEPRNKWFSL